MLQYYLRAEGLALSIVGTGRFIFSLNYSDADFAEGKWCERRSRGFADAEGDYRGQIEALSAIPEHLRTAR